MRDRKLFEAKNLRMLVETHLQKNSGQNSCFNVKWNIRFTLYRLYVLCCEFENLEEISDALYSNVTIRAGEYFEGEEVMDKNGEEVQAFDLISNFRLIPGTNST